MKICNNHITTLLTKLAQEGQCGMILDKFLFRALTSMNAQKRMQQHDIALNQIVIFFWTILQSITGERFCQNIDNKSN